MVVWSNLGVMCSWVPMNSEILLCNLKCNSMLDLRWSQKTACSGRFGRNRGGATMRLFIEESPHRLNALPNPPAIAPYVLTSRPLEDCTV